MLELGLECPLIFKRHLFQRGFIHLIIASIDEALDATMLRIRHDDVVLLFHGQVSRILTQDFAQFCITVVESLKLLLNFPDSIFLLLFFGALGGSFGVLCIFGIDGVCFLSDFDFGVSANLRYVVKVVLVVIIKEPFAFLFLLRLRCWFLFFLRVGRGRRRLRFCTAEAPANRSEFSLVNLL